jgi:hypothetical protein
MGAMRKWEVLLDRGSVDGKCNPLVALQTLYLERESEAEVREALNGYADAVKAIACVEVLIPRDGWLNKEQAAAYMGCSPALVDKMMAGGILPKAEGGYPMFKRGWLDRALEQRMRWPADVKEAA